MTTATGLRLHIALVGRRNVGKSSLLNALTQQATAIVSPVAGTTTDPVAKPMELPPLGPVLLLDTAGVDDDGALGPQRLAKTREVLERTELALLVAEAGAWGAAEDALLAELRTRQLPVVVVCTKGDLRPADPACLSRLAAQQIPTVTVAAPTGEGLGELRRVLLAAAPPERRDPPPLVADLVGPGGLAVLVVPIDTEAPQGRLILPQVQAIRDLLDGDAACLVVKERELRHALSRLTAPPALVVTDSQAFLKVAADIPPAVPLTSFSILLARAKGDLATQVQGALGIERLHAGDRVLIAEACSHHPIGEDIGRVKIPRWLTQYVGGRLQIDHVQGPDFPTDLSSYRLVIHCGACMWTRQAMQQRLRRCAAAGVPITNYGLTIAYSLGIFARALSPFPAALEAVRAAHRREAGAPC